MTFTPPRNKFQPLGDKVYNDLLDDIVARRRTSGERMVEAEIARTLNVSRTPVREALNRLENDGLIQSVKPAGYVVMHPSMEDIYEIFEIRRALEPVAFASVVAQATDEDLEEFRALQRVVDRADTPAGSARANRAFRAGWLERIRNARLRETLNRFHMQVHLVRAATLHSDAGRKAAQDGSRRLLDAFENRDTAMAHAAMQDFVDAALSFFEQAYAEGILQTTPDPQTDGQEPMGDQKAGQRSRRFNTVRTL